MRSTSPSESTLQATSVAGIVASFGLFYPAFFVPGLALLALPASAIFLAGMLYVTR